jgi:hypothetical protein
MTTALSVAEAELARGVYEIPRGSNRGPDVEKYLASVERFPGDAWCAAFVYWCVEKAANNLGLKNPLKKTGRVAIMWDAAAESGMAIDAADVRSGNTDIPSGAIFCVVHANGNGHTGFVKSRDRDKLFTIEGNTNISGSPEGDGLYSRTRSLSRYKAIIGFIVY